ncbi:MAG TPA: hypothetical protein VI584_07220 [Nitrospiria bacterium]|nr:hypothetical protein [Nitrospiria bacterium]
MVAPLTHEEVKNLEQNYDRLMQMAAELDRGLYELNEEMLHIMKMYSDARGELDMLKLKRSTLIERSRLISRMLSKF